MSAVFNNDRHPGEFTNIGQRFNQYIGNTWGHGFRHPSGAGIQIKKNNFTRINCVIWSFQKFQIPSTKLQINLKFQFSMTQTIVISNFGHCDLFGICDW